MDRHQAEAYDICDLARKLYASGNQEADLAVIDNKDATIISMSKMIVNMMELLKVESLVREISKFTSLLLSPSHD